MAKGGTAAMLIGAAALAAAGGGYSQESAEALSDLGEAGAESGTLVYSKEMEFEADQFVVDTLAEAGFDPPKGGDVFTRLEHRTRSGRAAGSKSFVSYFSTTPLTTGDARSGTRRCAR